MENIAAHRLQMQKQRERDQQSKLFYMSKIIDHASLKAHIKTVLQQSSEDKDIFKFSKKKKVSGQFNLYKLQGAVQALDIS